MTVLVCQKNRFSIRDGIAYLNGAYMSPLPDAVVAAGVEGVKRKADPSLIVPADFFSGPDEVRERFAVLINAPDSSSITIIPAVSYAMGLVTHNLPVAAGQNVVTVDAQFPSNMHPWRRRCAQTGAELRVVESPLPAGADGRSDAWTGAVCDAIDKNTALVAMANVHWTDGTRFDLSRVGRRAHDVEALFVIDGTQSIGAMPFDVTELQPDLVACAAYKWLMGPYGIGVAYLSERLHDYIPLEETWMGRRGSEQFGGLVDYVDEYRPGALRHDMGEASSFALIPMMAAGLTYLSELGVDNIAAYCRALTEPVVAPLRGAGYGVGTTADRAGHLFGISLPDDVTPTHVADRLAGAGVIVSVRGTSVRVSPNVYNDQADVDRLVKEMLALKT